MTTVANPQQQQSATGVQSYQGNPGAFYNASGLTQLGGGQQAFAQPTSEPSSNLPFDPRLRRMSTFNKQTGKTNSGGFTQGVNTQSGAMSTIGVGGQLFTTYFQFNPTEIDIAYEFDTSVIGALNPQYLNPGAAGTASQGLMLNQSVSFTLMFDRTYEVWTGPTQAPTTSAGNEITTQQAWSGIPGIPGTSAAPLNGAGPPAPGTTNTFKDPTNGKGPYMFGAQWDVWSVERMVGIYGQWSGKGPSGPPASGLIYVQFSPINLGLVANIGDATAAAGTQSYAMAFAGWMTSLEATYTRFDAGMVPTRAAVAVSFEQIYSLPAQTTANPAPTPGNG